MSRLGAKIFCKFYNTFCIIFVEYYTLTCNLYFSFKYYLYIIASESRFKNLGDKEMNFCQDYIRYISYNKQKKRWQSYVQIQAKISPNNRQFYVQIE